MKLLGRSPAVTLGILACAAIGVGVASLALNVALSILRPRVPYPAAARLASLGQTGIVDFTGFPDARRLARHTITRSVIQDLRAQPDLVEAVLPLVRVALSLGDDNFSTLGVAVPHDLLPRLGVSPMMGRSFLAEEDSPGNGQVVLLGHRWWRTRFARDPNIVGRQIRTRGGDLLTVVGVMDSVVAFPPRHEASFLLPLGGPGVERLDSPMEEALVVLRPGVELGALEAAASASANRNAAADREAWRAHVAAGGRVYVPPDEPVRIEAWPYRGPPFRSDDVWAALLLAGLGAVVLLVGTLNIASLALARSAAAERDLAVRSALGATRVRLALGIVSEVTTAVLVGGLIGAGIAAPVASALRASAGPDFSVLFPRVDARILAAAMVFTLLAGLSAAAWPASRVFRSDLQSSLQRGRASWRGAPGVGGLRRVVAAEIAVSTLLSAVAVFFMAALARHERLDRGFRTDDVVYARVSTREEATAEERALALQSTLDAARGLPGVLSAAVGSVPVSTSVTLSAREVATSGGAVVPGYVWIGPVLGDYLETLGIGLLAGRDITRAEARQGAPVAVVSRSLAERLDPGGDALGAQLLVGDAEEGRIGAEVVGITADLALPSGLPMGHVFVPYALRPESQAGVVLRVEGAASSALEGLRVLVSAPGGELTLVEATTLASGVRQSARIQAFLGAMVGVLAGMTLLLAAAGTYGVLAYTTRCRTHELGIRLAMGSSPGRLLRLVLLEALQPIGGGALVGLLGAMLAAAGMSSMLLGIRSTDPRVLGVTAVAIVAVGLISVLPSALGAARTDPAIPLRSD